MLDSHPSTLPQPESRVNILLVDDHPENLLALESVLEGLGQNLIRANSGYEALKHLLHEEFAVILLDVQMPGMDGFETATLIRSRARTQHTPIIFLTAINKGEGHVSQGYSLGAVDYVFKPFEAEVLRSKVAAFVELAKKTKQLQQEIHQRQRAEEKVRKLNRELERRVKERTAELEAAVGNLKTEVAERKQLQAALQQRAEDLAEADRRKDEFLAMLGHELRNPLAPILNAIHVLRQRGADNAALDRARDIVERQVRHVARLIDDLLDVSRITQGKIELREETVELSQMLEMAVEAAGPLVQECGHRLTVSLPPGPIWLRADGVRLQQVFSNLLNNAAKYTDFGGHISLSAGMEGGEAVIRVRDSGMGIPPESLPLIFDLFTQGERSIDRAQGGLGVGLTMVRKLVQMHRGSVEAHSEGGGKGSEFIVRLPALSAEAIREFGEAAETPELLNGSSLPDEEASADAGHCASRKVLLIEDNADAAESLCDVLRLMGYEVQWSTSGAAGVEMARHFRPRVVLCDIGLPEMDGYEVARTLRRESIFAETTLIALTGYGQKEDRIRTREAGFDLHLVKPVDPESLQLLLESPLQPEPCPP